MLCLAASAMSSSTAVVVGAGGRCAAAVLLACAAIVTVVVDGQGNETEFESGWNGQAMLPPMGWRSWNSMGACIKAGLPGDGSNCTMPDGKPPALGGQVGHPNHHYCPGICGSIADAIDNLTAKIHKVDGKLVSLADVGCVSVVDPTWSLLMKL